MTETRAAQLLWEGLQEIAVEIHSAEHLQTRLWRGDRLKVKLGLDPTAPDLHLGHTIQLGALRAFQDAGHTAVLIVGDYTAQIGDPSGRSETRPMLTAEQVVVNAQTYLEQAGRILDLERAEVHGNAEWLGRMTAADVLRLLGTQTLQSVLQREDFSHRLQSGAAIGAHEILYPFSQGYDSVAVRADVEIGGSDQLFNLLFGREVQRAYGQPPQDVMIFPLLVGPDGRRMSKSLGNYIGVAAPAPEIYGKVMSLPDTLIEQYLRLVSGLAPDEITAALRLPARDAKAALARAVVTRLAGQEPAAAAERDFEAKFRSRNLDETEIPLLQVRAGTTVAAALVAAGLYGSLSQVRRLAEQGGLSLNGEKVASDHLVEDGGMVKAGKRNFVRLSVG
ncbi:MAG: tyrosine--tRNA ligase [Candidatus Dormibacteraeota bacterium]|uniref:Tyrosine--tRNA ligase n=1 Tax=Candidatus Dormiibacter inghamiae TaxID=3127013 RepID=A0A934KIZ1_9BACT|nr:tyrosine--tRNA ligase [Candidatus Dormibacteraeota bacterium]MBJ7607455.1 tyrosine--tRNA ligase [Candidatus Dormibacteraeota bacterium]